MTSAEAAMGATSIEIGTEAPSETRIGPTLTVEGEISGDGRVVVEGAVKGSLAVAEVVIARQGQVEASLTGRSITIAGRHVGSAVASERVELTADGKMTGDIKAPRILIAEGAELSGRVDMTRG